MFTEHENEVSGVTEIVEDWTGKKIKRYRSDHIYALGLMFLLVGMALIAMDFSFGFTMVAVLFPICMLYPTVRFLFGGKDSIGAVIVTAILTNPATYKKKKKKSC